MQQNIQTHTFENGLTLIVQNMTGVKSAAFSLLVPSGSIYDAPNKNGSASVLSDWIARGAGDYNSRELSSALDCLGLSRSESAGSTHLGFSGATVATKIVDALKIYSQIVLQPHLPEDQFDSARTGIMQSVQSMQDEPRQKVMLELRRRCYNAPWGSPTDGTIETLTQLQAANVKEHYARCFRPNGSILGIAGNVNFSEMRDLVQELFGDWEQKEEQPIQIAPPETALGYLQQDSTQTHIGIAYNAVPYSSPDYYAAWAAVSLLSGGMSSRLFTEVREKRGLCYAISASLSTLKEEGRVLCYAGTTAERAEETLEVTLHELQRLEEGIEEEELTRCKARAKSSLIMQQESSISRAGSLARDWYHLGCVRQLDEVRNKVESLTTENVLQYLKEYPAADFTIMTIGPQPIPCAS